MFDLAKEAFDQIAILVDDGIEAAPCGGCDPARDDGLCARGRDGVHGALTIVTLVRTYCKIGVMLIH